MTKEVLVIVRGTGAFPIDMLRYDALRPASEHDSGLITNTFFRGGGKEPREITLLGLRATEGRWESFGWKVVHTEVRR